MEVDELANQLYSAIRSVVRAEQLSRRDPADEIEDDDGQEVRVALQQEQARAELHNAVEAIIEAK